MIVKNRFHTNDMFIICITIFTTNITNKISSIFSNRSSTSLHAGLLNNNLNSSRSNSKNSLDKTISSWFLGSFFLKIFIWSLFTYSLISIDKHFSDISLFFVNSCVGAIVICDPISTLALHKVLVAFHFEFF